MSPFKHLFLLSLFSCLFLNMEAQEFKLNVKINAPRLQLADPKVFETLEKEIYDFFNSTKWTDNEYEEFEKIEGNINITISEETSVNSFVMDFYVQAIRPVYNSNYKSQIINFSDKGIPLFYVENQPIQNSISSYIDPLSSLLTYYAYLILGFDYDSFAPTGGQDHFLTAQSVVRNVPQGAAGGTGWDQNSRDNKSRFRIIEDLLDPRAQPFRQAMYEYHIKSLDTMHEDAGKARAIMLSAITSIGKVNAAILNSGIIQMFCDSKREEIIEIYKGGDRGQQSKVYDIMVTMDPARASDYAGIK